MDGGAWGATVHGVAKSQTRLSDFTHSLRSITMNKASGDHGIPTELFQILKDDAIKMLHSIYHKFGNLSSGHRTGKGQFSFQFQRRAMPKHVQRLYS